MAKRASKKTKAEDEQIVEGAPPISEEAKAALAGVVKAQVSEADDVQAAAVVIDRIIPLPPLDPSEVKTAYESNADTNAFTDAADNKLRGIEPGAQVNPTGAAIVSSIDTQLGSNTWQQGGGSGGGGGLAFGAIDRSSGGATASMRYLGSAAPTMAGDGANGYDITVPAGSHLLSIDFKGDSTTTNAAGETVIRVDNSANSYERRFSMTIVDGGPDQDADLELRGHILKETVAGNVTTLSTPNIAGNYPSGFIMKLR